MRHLTLPATPPRPRTASPRDQVAATSGAVRGAATASLAPGRRG